MTSAFDLQVSTGTIDDLTQGTAIADVEWAESAGVSVGDRVSVCCSPPGRPAGSRWKERSSRPMPGCSAA